MARVLHIEDDPRNRLLVRKLLAADGHEVIDAADGLEGVREAMRETPDIILVDLNIPGLDGYEVTLRLRSEAKLRSVPIVAITAEGDKDTSIAVGCDGFLQKPIDARNFSKQVTAYLNGVRQVQSSSPEVNEERLRAQSGRIVVRLEQKVAELSLANERLRDAERLRTEFYRNVSHELATPLTPIVGYLRMLIDAELGPLEPAQKKALKSMDDCVKRLRNTLDNLVDVTGLELGKMRFMHKDYDFLDTVRRAVASRADEIAERKITLLEEFPRGSMAGVGDPDRLLRAMGQLLDNAIKYTPEGSILGLRVQARDAQFELTVVDSGPGLPKEGRDKIFEAFYQVDGSPTRSYEGVGVGLAIARRVARGLGGDLRVNENGAEVEGMFLGGAVFNLSVAKRAPIAVA